MEEGMSVGLGGVGGRVGVGRRYGWGRVRGRGHSSVPMREISMNVKEVGVRLRVMARPSG